MDRVKQSELPPLAEMQAEIEQWFATGLGQQLLAQERQMLDSIMPKLYGYHLLQIGVIADADLAEQSPAGHRFTLIPEVKLGVAENTLVGEMECLPIASECVDAVVLHHALDFSRSPQQTLREAVRVLRPGGRLVVVGFNPLSFWGVFRLSQKRRPQVPWQAHFMSSHRILDWLALLEMKCERVESGFYRPPWHSSRWMLRMMFCERWGRRSKSVNGAYWMVTASKETYTGTPVGTSWRRRFALPLSSVQSPRAGRQVSRAGTAAKPEHAEGARP